MKYVVILYDGMADYPVPALGGKTPMAAAKKPNLDYLAAHGEVGLVRTVAKGLTPGSDVANLSVMGYDPKQYYTGRSPLEAVSMGIELSDTDVALRCNLVTLSDEENYGDKKMLDYCADDISTAEAAEIIKAVQEKLGGGAYDFYSGVSYRHCLVWHGGNVDIGDMTAPHDISNKLIGGWLCAHPDASGLVGLMKKSCDILKNHEINRRRIERGKRPANAIWLWGQGSKPTLPSFESEHRLKGSVISAVDLLKGIGKCAGMSVPSVKGATGYIDTDFSGKAEACLKELAQGKDFVYLHIEAPDECGHRNEPENKVRSIELIDELVLPVILDGLKAYDDYKIMILPDHPTPIVTGSHASDPVPYMIYHKNKEFESGVASINEESAKKTGRFIENGPSIMNYFLSDK